MSDTSWNPSHIAIFSALYPPSAGGVEQFTEHLSNALAARGYRVTIVTNNLFGEASHEELSQHEEIFRLPCFGLFGDRLPVPAFGKGFESLWAQLLALDVDAVLINTRFYPHTLLGLEYAKRIGCRPIVLEHGSGHIGFGNPLSDIAVRCYEHAITEVISSCHPAFYGVSDKCVEWLHHYGITAEGVITGAVDAEEFRTSSSGRNFRSELCVDSERLVVASVGRLIDGKGTDLVIETARRFRDADDGPIFLVAGDGPELERYQSIAPENVRFLGKIPSEDVSALLQIADVFFFPATKPEGGPLTVLEAGACGAAILASDVGIVRQVIPDDTFGIVLDDQELNPDVLAEYVRYYDECRDICVIQGDRCRRRILKKFTWDESARALIEAFQRSCSPSENLVRLGVDASERSYPSGALQRVQEIELELLSVFDSICRAEDIPYFLASGSCLGAIRHGGFIPWDDDIDVGIPFRDYQRFLEVAPGLLPDGVSMRSVENTPHAAFLWTKLCRDGTRFLEDDNIQAGMDEAIFIDIFPYVQLDENEMLARGQFALFRLLQGSSYLHCIEHPSGARKGAHPELGDALAFLAHHTVARPLTPQLLQSLFFRLCEAGKGDGRWVDPCGSTPAFHTTETMFPVQKALFAGMESFVPNNPDEYLTALFGDYMTLPPVEKRHTHTPHVLDFGDGVNVMDQHSEMTQSSPL